MEKSSSRWWDWPSAILLLAAIFTSGARLGITDWAKHLDYVGTFGMVGATLGLSLGVSRFNRRVVAGLAIAYTLVLLPLRLSSMAITSAPLGTRLASMVDRLGYSLGNFFQGQAVLDPLFFITLLSLIYWTMGLLAGYWLVRRGSFLGAILPAGLAILIVQLNDAVPLRMWFLAVYFFISLALLGRINYLRNQRTWRAEHIFTVPESSYDLTNGILISAAILVLIAWTVPSTVSDTTARSQRWIRLIQPWQELRQRASDLFASVELPGESDFYGNRLNLGTGNPLGHDVVLSVHLASVENKPARFYWRGRVYDRYEGNWSSTAIASANFSPQEPDIPIPDISGRRLEDITITSGVEQYTLYTASEPVWVDHKAKLQYNLTQDNTSDVVAILADKAIEPNQTYITRSAIANPTLTQLRTAGTAYPDWVQNHYLQLPENFSQRLRDLAVEITQDALTPYDKADRITTYLRQNIEYSPTISPPPLGRDPLEWVVLESKRGFCNYYATAEVLMLRSLGIPARMAVGFAQGEVDDTGLNYTVLERDAHAWPEVYFPGIGWVEFEPTSNQNALVRPAGIDVTSRNNSSENDSNTGLFPQNPIENMPEDIEIPTGESTLKPRVGLWVTLSAIALIGILVTFWLLDWRYQLSGRIPIAAQDLLENQGLRTPKWLVEWARKARLSPTERAFQSINRGLRWLGQAAPAHATPAQRANTLSELIPQAAPDIQALADEHQRSLYSPVPGNPDRARRASFKVLWRSLLAAIRRLSNELKQKLTSVTRL